MPVSTETLIHARAPVAAKQATLLVLHVSTPQSPTAVIQTRSHSPLEPWMEHKYLLDLCRHLQDKGCDITYIAVKNNGLINLEHLEKDIRANTELVSIMTVNNEIRVIHQMEEIAKLYPKQGVLFYTTGVQAWGKIPVEVGTWNVGWMSISSTKV
ncbi:pyridoxal phosphate-dependent transferase [Tuber brumale]|nr:pyridoxal phosphate-dependent transferase [Tuber brumale]